MASAPEAALQELLVRQPVKHTLIDASKDTPPALDVSQHAHYCRRV